MKMVVDTSFTKSSGPSGGTPMFSRVGKQTIAEDLTYQTEPGVIGISTFEVARRHNAGGNKNQIGSIPEDDCDSEDDEADIQDFVPL